MILSIRAILTRLISLKRVGLDGDHQLAFRSLVDVGEDLV
jgi:hypothetical protein